MLLTETFFNNVLSLQKMLGYLNYVYHKDNEGESKVLTRSYFYADKP